MTKKVQVNFHGNATVPYNAEVTSIIWRALVDAGCDVHFVGSEDVEYARERAAFEAEKRTWRYKIREGVGLVILVLYCLGGFAYHGVLHLWSKVWKPRDKRN